MEKSQPPPDEADPGGMPPYEIIKHSCFRSGGDKCYTIIMLAHLLHPSGGMRAVGRIQPHPSKPWLTQAVIGGSPTAFRRLPWHMCGSTGIKVEITKDLDYFWRSEPIGIGVGAVGLISRHRYFPNPTEWAISLEEYWARICRSASKASEASIAWRRS